MEQDNGDHHDWPMQRRVEGFVNKHMADIAVEALQQRLSAVSDEMHSLAEHVSRRSGEDFKDEPRRGDASLDVEPLLSSACSYRATDKFISAPPTGTIYWTPRQNLEVVWICLNGLSGRCIIKLLLAIQLNLFYVRAEHTRSLLL